MNHVVTARSLAVVALLGLISCRDPGSGRHDPNASSLLHLTDRLQEAAVVSAGPPDSARQERRWVFDVSQPDWRTISSQDVPFLAPVELEETADALRLTLAVSPMPMRFGGLVIDLGELRFEDWETVRVRARTRDRFAGVTLAYNLDEEGAIPHPRHFFASADAAPPLFSDGSEQTYAIPLRRREAAPDEDEPEAGESGEDAGPAASLRTLAVIFGAAGPASVDILSIALVPRGAAFLDDFGTRPVVRDGTTRDTLFAHAPATLSFPVGVEQAGRFDFGLAVNPGETVTYRVHAEIGGRQRLLFEETVDDSGAWHQRSVDLSRLDSPPTRVILEAESDLEGAAALWGAPIVSGAVEAVRRAQLSLPNVIFYVIDGGDADLMSLYGYERPTTPFLEELAREGTLFTRAHSNATWTQPSTVSFMTSLQHSVLGGLRRGVHSTSVPKTAVTMAEHFRRAGYQTASFTANPNAGRMIGLERGVDLMRDVETENHSTSSVDLHEQFWSFREAYPGSPRWVHFQTTDVHEPYQPEEPFAGRYVSAEERARLGEWQSKIWQVAASHFGATSVAGFHDIALEKAGIDRHDFFSAHKGLYDETMTHQDHALRQFVARLKEEGEWENTLFVLGSDHGHPAGTFTRFGRGLFEPQPEPWQGALFDAYATRVPLLVIWPGHVESGQRIDQPVSMIDVLPTILDLVGLPPPAILQGQSLAPLLHGEEMQPRPVILDEFRVDEATGEMIGNLEMIDGKWGASLEIAPVAEGADPTLGRHAVPAGGRWGAVHPYFEEVPRLLLYDLEEDPFALRSVHEEHPEVARRYHRLLLDQWRAHRSLSEHFRETGEVALTPEQLEQLQALGYIQ